MELLELLKHGIAQNHTNVSLGTASITKSYQDVDMVEISCALGTKRKSYHEQRLGQCG